jgi:hypothetical protein
MNLQVKLAVTGDLAAFAEQTHLRIARGARIAAEKQAARAKLALRGDVRAAGLGDRLANTWRVNVFPRSSSVHTHEPAVFVKNRAPEVVTAHAGGMTIRSHTGVWLAIPTENVPRVARAANPGAVGRPGTRFQSRATPEEVESIFDQDLIFIPGRGGQMLAFIDKTLRGKLKRARAKGKSVATVQARFDKLVLMFVMVRQVTLRKRLNWPRIFDDLAKGWAQLFPAEIAAALNARSN